MSSLKVILSIDDDVDFNELLRVELKSYPVILITTTNSNDFFRRFASAKPDLCLVDLNIGGDQKLGFKIITKVREQPGGQIPLLVLSGENNSEKVTFALELGANDYVIKPLDTSFLREKLDYFLDLGDENEEKRLFPIVPTPLSKIDITMKFQITSINEFGLEIISDTYFARGSRLKVSSRLFDQMGIRRRFPCVVSNTALIKEGAFSISLEYEGDDETFSSKMRKWIASQK